MAAAQGYALDIGPTRFHHEIYLGDPRAVQAGKPQNRAAAPHTKTSRGIKAQVLFRCLVQTKKVREDITSLTFLYR